MEGNLLLEQFSRYKKLELEASPFHFLLDANIELNPHQINAFCAAIQALKTGGIVLADEVGLGKTIEAGLVLKYVLESGAKRVLIALPASLRKQWELELEDMLHEHRKAVLREYCSDNDLDCVKPIVLIACKDTDHAKKIRALIDSDDFQKGKYKGKVIEIHSKQSGEESEENIRLLLSIESASNPIEIVLHVYKLKEGWDVNNLFTIIPLNAAKSDILAMQTIGRGLRLPFGEQTGNEDLDSLDIVAHDHYRELVDEIKSSDIFRYRDLDKTTVEPSESVGVSATVDDGQLSLLDFAITASGVKSFAEVSNPKTQLEIYQEYVKNFMAAQKKDKGEDLGQMTLFDFHPEMLSEDTTEPSVTAQEQPQTPTALKSGKQPLSKDEFVKAVTEYSAKAISVPKILVQTTSEVKFNRFEVKRTIADFEVAMAKIERFDAINQQLLSVVDAQILEVNDAMNTLACMLLDSISELSYDDADFVIDVVEQYLSQIPGDEENKRRIVRRYASLIVSDIRKQIYEHILALWLLLSPTEDSAPPMEENIILTAA